MQKALHVRTTVLPGGRVEVASPELDFIINYDIKYRMGREG